MSQIQTGVDDGHLAAFARISGVFPRFRCSVDVVGIIGFRRFVERGEDDFLHAVQLFQLLQIAVSRGDADTAKSDRIIVIYRYIVHFIHGVFRYIFLLFQKSLLRVFRPEALGDFRRFVTAFQKGFFIQHQDGLHLFILLDILLRRQFFLIRPAALDPGLFRGFALRGLHAVFLDVAIPIGIGRVFIRCFLCIFGCRGVLIRAFIICLQRSAVLSQIIFFRRLRLALTRRTALTCRSAFSCKDRCGLSAEEQHGC